MQLKSIITKPDAATVSCISFRLVLEPVVLQRVPRNAMPAVGPPPELHHQEYVSAIFPELYADIDAVSACHMLSSAYQVTPCLCIALPTT